MSIKYNIMRYSLFISSLSFLLLFSCSSGDDNDNSNEEDNALLLRKWYLVSSTFNGQTFTHEGCSNGNKDYIEFSEPNNFESYVYESSDNCNYILEASGSWSREGVLLTIDYDQPYPTSVDTIDELTATTFSFVTENGAYYIYSSIN